MIVEKTKKFLTSVQTCTEVFYCEFKDDFLYIYIYFLCMFLLGKCCHGA